QAGVEEGEESRRTGRRTGRRSSGGTARGRHSTGGRRSTGRRHSTGGRDHRPGDERRQVMSEPTPETPAAPRVPEAVGVYGGGRMGAGIAHAFATAGARVIVIESTDDTVVAARGRIDASIEKSQSKGI